MLKNGLAMRVYGALHASAVGLVLGVVGLALEVLAHRAPDLVRQAAVAFGGHSHEMLLVLEGNFRRDDGPAPGDRGHAFSLYLGEVV